MTWIQMSPIADPGDIVRGISSKWRDREFEVLDYEEDDTGFNDWLTLRDLQTGEVVEAWGYRFEVIARKLPCHSGKTG